MTRQDFYSLIGFSEATPSLRESLVSFLGGALGIIGVILISFWLLDPQSAVYIIPSLGASAVLLFAAPHVPFSQPWNLVGGHAVSALIGVACWQWIPDYTLAAGASVGIAIGVMVLLRCIHPPGGATALAAVIGTDRLHDLGYSYLFAPVLLNVVTILLVAIAFNYLFDWRRYPAYLKSDVAEPAPAPRGYPPIEHADFVYALSHIDTFVDIDEKDLLRIYSLATRRHQQESR